MVKSPHVCMIGFVRCLVCCYLCGWSDDLGLHDAHYTRMIGKLGTLLIQIFKCVQYIPSGPPKPPKQWWTLRLSDDIDSTNVNLSLNNEQ